MGSQYYKTAVETIYEIGLKLCYVFWRKFDEAQSEEADREFNALCVNLISDRSYSLAETLLRFGHSVPRIKDQTRRMMIINLANVMRLQNKKEGGKKLLESEDWSASSDDFKISIAAVNEKLDDVTALMEQIGKGIDPDHYRSWPVFRGMRNEPKFIDTFERIFNESFLLVAPKTDKQESVGNASNANLAAQEFHADKLH